MNYYFFKNYLPFIINLFLFWMNPYQIIKFNHLNLKENLNFIFKIFFLVFIFFRFLFVIYQWIGYHIIIRAIISLVNLYFSQILHHHSHLKNFENQRNLFIIFNWRFYFVLFSRCTFQFYFSDNRSINWPILLVLIATTTKYQPMLSINQFNFISKKPLIYNNQAFLSTIYLLISNLKSHSIVLQKFSSNFWHFYQ